MIKIGFRYTFSISSIETRVKGEILVLIIHASMLGGGLASGSQFAEQTFGYGVKGLGRLTANWKLAPPRFRNFRIRILWCLSKTRKLPGMEALQTLTMSAS